MCHRRKSSSRNGDNTCQQRQNSSRSARDTCHQHQTSSCDTKHTCHHHPGSSSRGDHTCHQHSDSRNHMETTCISGKNSNPDGNATCHQRHGTRFCAGDTCRQQFSSNRSSRHTASSTKAGPSVIPPEEPLQWFHSGRRDTKALPDHNQLMEQFPTTQRNRLRNHPANVRVNGQNPLPSPRFQVDPPRECPPAPSPGNGRGNKVNSTVLPITC